MKKLIVILLFASWAASSGLAADFAPTTLRIDAPRIMQYDFDGSSLEFPVMVSGTNAGIILCIFTKDCAGDIPYSVNGYLGWHMVNNVDTCVYYSPLKSVQAGETVMQWDGKDQDGAIVPAGAYTYYLWAFDNQGEKQIMSQYLDSGWGFDMTTAIRERDEQGIPLANPIWYRADKRWRIGSDPTDESLLVTTAIQLDNGWSYRGEPLMEPGDFSYFYLNVANNGLRTAALQKFKWVPGGVADIQRNWGEQNGYSEQYDTSGGGSPGVVTDGVYLFTADDSHLASTDPDAQFYIYDYEGYMVEEIDLTPWWSNPDDYEAGGQMNGGPNNFFARDNYVFLNCHCSCLNQMVCPQRYLETGEYDDFFVWSNGNGDYTLDRNFEETAILRWVCNDYNVGPYKYSISADANLFSAANAYDVGAVSFGLLAPDGTGLGYLAYAGETAGWKRGTLFLDADTPFDGIYCDNEQMYTDWGRYKNSTLKESATAYNIYFIGHDSFKGIIAGYGPLPELTPSITVTSPNGGEELVRNTTAAITWRFTRVDNVRIEFSSDNGVTSTVIAESVRASAGRFMWTVPGNLSGQCIVTVTDTTNPETSDSSNHPFSIVRGQNEPAFVPDAENTGNNAIVLLTTNNPPSLDGVPLEEGDLIGVFTPRGNCAGVGEWKNENLAITVWGDDLQEAGTIGFLGGEPMTFKVWDGSENRIVLVEVSYERGDGLYRADGIYIIRSLDTRQVSHTVSIRRGWNIATLPIALPDRSIGGVLAPLGEAFVLAKNGRGEVCWPEYGIDGIRTWRITEALQVYAGSDTDFEVDGYDIFSPDIVYNLPADWSLISYIGGDGIPPSEAFKAVTNRLIAIKNAAGGIWWPSGDIDQIVSMNRGEGYWVYLSSPVSFSFPSSVTGKASSVMFAAKAAAWFTPVTNTGNNATVIVRSSIAPMLKGGPLTTGDEIAVTNSDGLCVGAGVWEAGRNLAFAVWGDDPMTDELDGMNSGEALLFNLWDSETGEVFGATALVGMSTPRYAPNALIALDSFLADTTYSVGVGDDAPVRFSLDRNTPNPFNPSTSISFTLPRECEAELTVYNIGGAKVATLASGRFSAGEHSVVWDASGQPSGVYFYRLRAGEYTGTGKMTLVK